MPPRQHPYRHAAGVLHRHDQARQGAAASPMQQRMQQHLAKLQSLLPHSQIPQEPFNDSTGLQCVLKAAVREIASASEEVKAAYKQGIEDIEGCLAVELFNIKSPTHFWASIDAHWLDRIDHMEKLLGSKNFSQVVSKINLRSGKNSEGVADSRYGK